jgi:hypothetical protein
MLNIEFLRSFRIFNIALFDVISSFIGTYLFLKFFIRGRREEFYYAWTIVLPIPLSILKLMSRIFHNFQIIS